MVRAWSDIEDALANDSVIEGLVKRRTKGGLIVDIYGVEAFLPGSQIDVKPIRDFDIYVGKKMEVKVVKINHANDNVVVSHKVLIEKDLEKAKSRNPEQPREGSGIGRCDQEHDQLRCIHRLGWCRWSPSHY
jgi:small subunit ribosomal protein S1